MNIYTGANIRYVLWTGGVDSTFMLLQFARKELTLQPIYVIDPDRKSIRYEIEAMNSIVNLLKTKYTNEVKAEILPITIYELKDIPPDENITESYKAISRKVKIGSQYEWLSRLASKYPFLDLGVEKHIDAFGGCPTAIMNDGGFVDKDGIGQLNTEKASQEAKTLFGKFRFPIYHFTETEMLSLVHSWNWDEIMKKTWFCHNPIDGKPCGMCRPCQQKMEDCMGELLPIVAQRRYKVFSFTKKLFGDRVSSKMVKIYRRLLK